MRSFFPVVQLGPHPQLPGLNGMNWKAQSSNAFHAISTETTTSLRRSQRRPR
jgi:hypothetical protein